jgi:hypothetical protein
MKGARHDIGPQLGFLFPLGALLDRIRSVTAHRIFMCLCAI